MTPEELKDDRTTIEAMRDTYGMGDPIACRWSVALAEVERLQAEIARLREALEPLAKAKGLPGRYQVWGPSQADIDRARAALEGK